MSTEAEARFTLLRQAEDRIHRIATGGTRQLHIFELTDEQKETLLGARNIIRELMGDRKPPREAYAAKLATKAEEREAKKAAKALVAEAKAAERAALKAAKAEMKLQENTAKNEAKLAADKLKEEAKEAAKAAALEAKKAAREAAEKVRKEMLAKFEAQRTAILGTTMPAIDPATATQPIRRGKGGLETASVPKGKMQTV